MNFIFLYKTLKLKYYNDGLTIVQKYIHLNYITKCNNKQKSESYKIIIIVYIDQCQNIQSVESEGTYLKYVNICSFKPFCSNLHK